MPLFLARRLLAGTAIFCTAVVPAAAFAQSAETPAPDTGSGEVSNSAAIGLGDIVVTASKRSENLQKAPAAISVVGGDLIADVGLVDATQLTKLVPSLVIGRQGQNAVVFLRGVGQTNSTPAAQPGISLNIDGVYLPRELGGSSLFDLERVEVLPGPQGTLYGRNSAGGAINLVTRKPGTDFAAEGYVEVGNYALVHGFGAVDIPVADGVAVRGALDVNQRDGYLSNGAFDEDSLAGRVSVNLEPSDRVSALVQYSYIRQGGVGMAFMSRGGDAGPPFGSTTDPWFNSFPNDDLSYRNRGHIVTGNLGIELNDDITLNYIPSYMQDRSLHNLQFNGNMFNAFRQSVKQYSQELRLANSGTGPLNWLAGLFWYKSHSTIDVDLNPAYALGFPVPFVFVNFDNKLKSWAAFGQATYSVSDALRVTLGGRYSHDKFDGGGSQIVLSPPAPSGSVEIFDGSGKKGRADWKIGAEYDAAPQSMLYLTAQSGYLQGGFTAVDKDAGLPRTFEPVKLIALTGGAKNRFFDNRLQINNEIFFYSYKNYQAQTVGVGANGATKFLVLNVPKTEIYGDQLDVMYSATENTDLNLSVAYLHAKVTKGFAPPTTPPPAGFRSFKGFDMPNAPKWTINASIEHRFPLSNGGRITARVASTYNSGYWTVFSQEAYTHQGSFTKTDANLTYNSPEDRWYFGAWARNLENNASYYGAGQPEFDGAHVPTFIDAPRTYGVRAGFNF